MPFPTTQKLQEMIIEAMKENAPTMYRRPQKEHQLKKFVLMRASSANQQFNELTSLVSQEDTKRIVLAQKQGYLQTVQAWNARQKAIEETVLAQALEFPTEQPEEP
ncbi:MAG: hypothetical protein ABIH03_06430 [Pseudomonadota bacterium]